MGKKKTRTSRVSMGGRQKANVAREAKRQAKFAEKRENGTAYEYKPIPFKKGTKAYNEEKLIRAEKSKSSKLPIARLKSIFAKLNNELEEKEELNKKKIINA